MPGKISLQTGTAITIVFGLVIAGLPFNRLLLAQGSVTTLNSGQQVSDAVSGGQQKSYRIAVPSGATQLTIQITGAGDADLYVKRGTQAGLSAWDCRPYTAGSNEQCSFSGPQAGDWYIMIRGYANGASSFTLTAAFVGGGSGGGGGSVVSALSSGQPASDAVVGGQQKAYRIVVPPGASQLAIQITGTGDADLYVKHGSQASLNAWDCRPYAGGSNEQCSFANPVAGDWYVMVHGYATATSNYTLTATFVGGGGGSSGGGGGSGVTTLNNGQPVNDAVLGGQQKVYRVAVPSGAVQLTIQIAGTGDADLYVKRGSQAGLNAWDCRPYAGGSSEQCSFNNPQAGDWYVMIHGYANSTSSYTLTATYTGAGGGSGGPVPAGFDLLHSSTGVRVYRRFYAGGQPDFVSVVNLTNATIRSLTGPVTGTPYGVVSRKTLSQFWSDAVNQQTSQVQAKIVVNGTFFSTDDNPTGIAFGLKVNGGVVSYGYGLNEYPGLTRTLTFNSSTGIATIQPYDLGVINGFPDAVGCLDQAAPKDPSSYRQRTFVGVRDSDGNGTTETVLLFVSSYSRQVDAANVLTAFGATTVAMLDGGGSTGLIVDGTSYVPTTRALPHAIAVYAGK